MNRRRLLASAALVAAVAPASCGKHAFQAMAQQTCFDQFDRCFGNAQTSTTTLDLNFIAGSLDSRITYTGGGGTYFNAAGAITSASTNVARFDTDPVTLTPRGLLIEEARTNLLLNSATLSTQSVASLTATAYTLSFYGTGTVTLSGVSTAGPLVGSGAFPARVTLTFTPTAGTLTLTVTGQVLNAQLEAGGFVTSWISTTGAAATRTADVATMPTTGWYSATAGTLQAEWLAASAPTTGTQGGIARLDDSSDNNRAMLLLNAPSGTVGFSSRAATVDQLIANFGTGISAITRGGGSYNGTTWAATAGGAAISSTAGVAPTGINRLFLGASSGGSSWFLNGWLRRVRYWPRALSNGELAQVTK